MNQKNNHIDGQLNPNRLEIVSWSESYATGIEKIDNQHKELMKLTNELYRACLSGKDNANSAFKEAMRRMVEYVRFHFSDEQKLLERVKYPDYIEHKRQHDTLVMNILEAVKEFEKGNKFVPNSFVRTLKDWVFGHIAVLDKTYAFYINGQRKKGLITDQQLS